MSCQEMIGMLFRSVKSRASLIFVHIDMPNQMGKIGRTPEEK